MSEIATLLQTPMFWFWFFIALIAIGLPTSAIISEEKSDTEDHVAGRPPYSRF